ncbi:CrtD protein [Blastomonas sp. AAP25]|uniref:1-hydroxycarotenoid 3,4-desaturase CrtD n=1 Tax=Blastomonas sp. AAP25 TaxID=1523416 RepID=UPI0006B9D538|nr:1-hydroxycarotenoid 3,4-desaturase CrtD [Blastomonas sp. AAP25]KPF74281.1 CrtD protein [Blastomonas sp. AAP25]
MRHEPIIVVGAGVGGLSAAALLAAAGEPVLVVERQPTPGGKLREVMAAGRPVDGGPTVFTMRWVFDRLFADCGGDLATAIPLTPASMIARHAWGPEAPFDLLADVQASEAAIGEYFSAKDAAGFRTFCGEAARIFNVLREPYLEASAPTPFSLVTRIGLKRLPETMAIRPYQAMWKALGRHFADPRLQQLFGRYATYCGSSPFVAPATLMLIAHVEQDGVWLADNGMHSIATAIAELARSNGAQFRYDAPIAEIVVEQGRAAGVRLESGEVIRARAIVFNGDPAALNIGRLGDGVRRAVPPVPPKQRSLSSMTWLINAKTSGFPLVRHSVFFSNDYRAEFDSIFKRGQVPEAPTIYICAQDRDDHSARAPPGPERLQLIVNAPANGDTFQSSQAEIDQCERQVFGFLEDCGLTIDRTADNSHLVTPADYEGLFPATGGALYGRATHGWKAAFQRPGAASRLPGLYLAGGGIHPGAGIPMASLSGRLAAERLLADLPSMRSSRRVAMPGGTSTR